ncbi:Vitellogenin-4 [Armadillidium vulgare]|nr:Vitellogenin-4 [Armadillidium vulgare]
MEKQEISPERIASIFLTLPNNLYSPSVIPELMEYVKRLNIETNPLLTSSALINFASLAERVCINHKKINYTIPYALFGRENCGPEQILGDFLPFLEEKAKSASKYHERAIYLQAISNLGSPEIINILKPYIYGKNDKNLHVRSIAIYGLSHLRLPDSARERVFATLMSVVDNTTERSELRQVAFWTLITWHPISPNPPEPHLKHQSRIASFVLPLLKPYSPSLHLSYNRIYSRYDPQSKIGLNFDFSTIESRDDSLPFQIHTSLRENFGGLFIHLFEGSISSEKSWGHMRGILKVMRSVAEEGNHNMILKEHPNISFSSSVRDVISKVAGTDGERVIKELLSGVEIHATKYLNPIDLEYSSKLIVKLTVLSPLNQKVTEAGVENYSEMNLPFYGDLSLNRSNEIKNISLSVSPHTQRKFPIFHQHNVPFTMLRNVAPDDWMKDYKVIGVEKNRKPLLKVRNQLEQSYTGIASEIHGLNAQLFFNSNDFRRYEIVLGFAQELSLLKKTIGNKKYRMVTAVLASKGTFKISEEREKLISEELYRDPPVEFQTAPVYDVGTLDIEFSKDKIPKSILNASYSLQQFIEGALFPHGYHNNMFSGQPNKIRIETRSPVWSKKYSFSVETPQKHSIFSEIHLDGGFWLLDQVPPDVQEGEERGYIYQPPAETSPSPVTIATTEATKCVKK